MFSLRSVARSGARSIPRLAATTTSRAAIARPALRATATCFVARNSAFSTFNRLRSKEDAASTDVELSTKLQTEIQFESEVKAEETVPSAVKEFLENGPFKVNENPEKDDVILTRDYNDEKITITFSIADLANFEGENEMFDDEMNDEMNDGEFNENQRNLESGEEGGASDTRAPCRLHIVVEKPGKAQGALNIEATAADEGIMIESVYFYKDPKLAHTNTPEAEFASQEVYPGPPFNSLDEDLQVLMERFLEERGIDESLSVFASEYMGYKEQKEYCNWLTNVKAFIDA